MNLEIFCLECTLCRNMGDGRYPLGIRQERGDWVTSCGCCRSIVRSYFDGVMWVSQLAAYAA